MIGNQSFVDSLFSYGQHWLNDNFLKRCFDKAISVLMARSCKMIKFIHLAYMDESANFIILFTHYERVLVLIRHMVYKVVLLQSLANVHKDRLKIA